MILTIGLITVLGIASQWASWKFRVPAIILLLSLGFLFGPVLGLINPMEHLGQDVILTVVELFVALIQFDGAMQLKFREFKLVADGLKRILTTGVLFHFILLSVACFFLVEKSFGFAGLIAAILIVTGPTVVIPALREAKVNRKISHYLKWEGIITDPIGAFMAVVIYDAMVLTSQGGNSSVGLAVLKIVLIAIVFSLVLKEFIKYLYSNDRVPEYLKLPMMTAIVLGAFVFSNELQHGSGLLTVTILGMLVGNSKIEFLHQIREFKENITTLCISFVFILISACIEIESFFAITKGEFAFIFLASFVLRPIAILLSTQMSRMQLREKLLIGAYGPRGIVAVSVAAAISAEMKNDGLAAVGSSLMPIILLVVVTTVIAHSLYLPFLSRKLELGKKGGNGIVIIGTMPWVVDLSIKLKNLGIPVLVTSASWYKLAPFRNAGVDTFYGQVLDHVEDYDFSDYSTLMAFSENDSFNTLCCDRFSKVFGHQQVFKLKQTRNFLHDKYRVDKKNYCVYVNSLELKFENLMKYSEQGWQFKYTKISKNYSFKEFCFDNPKSIVCMKISADNKIEFGNNFKSKVMPGDFILSFSAPGVKKKKESMDLTSIIELTA